MYKRPRAARLSLGSLLVTFLLGAVIGGATVYGVIGGASEPAAPPPIELAAAPEAPDEEAATPEVEDAAPYEEAPEIPEEIEAPEPPEAAETDEPAAAPAEEAAAEAVFETIAEAEPEPVLDEDLPPIRGARFLFISTRGRTLSDASRAFLGEFKPGGVVLLGHNIENRNQTIAYVDAIKEAAGMGTARGDLPLIAVDQEGGTVNRLRLRQAPSAAEIGAAGDPAFAREIAAGYADACRARGIAVNFAPVLDIRDPDGHPAFARRAFSDDSGVVTELGLHFADGLLAGGVLAVAKHYPGHGSTAADSHDAPAILGQPLEQLAEIMYPFAEAAARGIPGIMPGHITVAAIDEGVPATLSDKLLTQILRERWEYDGVIISDDLNMRAISDRYSIEEAAVRALAAGCDALIVTESDFDTLRRVAAAIEDAVAEGRLDAEALRASERRLEAWQAWIREQGEEAPDRDSSDEAEELEPEPEESAEAEDVADDPDAPAEDPAQEEEPEATPAPDDTEGMVALRHEVQQGEWLSRVASRYGVTTQQLVRWNNLPNTDVRYGTVLTVYLPPDAAAAFTGEEVAPADEAPAEEEDPSEAAAPSPEPEAAAQPPGTRAITHDVLPGEMLTRLAERYGVRTSDIVAWNNLESTNIRIGDELVIYVPEEADSE